MATLEYFSCILRGVNFNVTNVTTIIESRASTKHDPRTYQSGRFLIGHKKLTLFRQGSQDFQVLKLNPNLFLD
jgi:hypothetical protein